eukprot:464800-Prorocentrum_lima.AAC.1
MAHVPPVMTNNTRVPPAWDPGHESQYPFQDWLVDVRLWASSTDVAENNRAPLVVLQLHGLAREIARE